MTTLKVTLPTKKAGHLEIFTIQFLITNFDAVIEDVSKIKNYNELKNSTLWQVI